MSNHKAVLSGWPAGALFTFTTYFRNHGHYGIHVRFVCVCECIFFPTTVLVVEFRFATGAVTVTWCACECTFFIFSFLHAFSKTNAIVGTFSFRICFMSHLCLGWMVQGWFAVTVFCCCCCCCSAWLFFRSCVVALLLHSLKQCSTVGRVEMARITDKIIPKKRNSKKN